MNMKKLLTLILIAFMAVSANAQLISGRTKTKVKRPQNDFFFVETTIGVNTNPDGDDGTRCGWNFGFGWRHKVTENHFLDAVKFKYSTNFLNVHQLKLMTGYRYNTAKFINDRISMYFNGGLGLALDLGGDALPGLAYDLGFGFNVTKNFYVGLTWDAAWLFGTSYEYKRKERYYDKYGWDTHYVDVTNPHVGTFGVQFGVQF